MDNKAGQQGSALANSMWHIADILHGNLNQYGKVTRQLSCRDARTGRSAGSKWPMPGETNQPASVKDGCSRTTIGARISLSP